MTDVMLAITAAGGSLITNVTAAVVAGIGVGVVIFGSLKAWRTFKKAAN